MLLEHTFNLQMIIFKFVICLHIKKEFLNFTFNYK